MKRSKTRDHSPHGAVWAGAPGNTPREIVNKLSTPVVNVAHSADPKERYAGLGLEPLSSTPEHYTDQMHNAIVRWRKVIAAAKIVPQ